MRLQEKRFKDLLQEFRRYNQLQQFFFPQFRTVNWTNPLKESEVTK